MTALSTRGSLRLGNARRIATSPEPSSAPTVAPASVGQAVKAVELARDVGGEDGPIAKETLTA